jgi:hypothetical protein
MTNLSNVSAQSTKDKMAKKRFFSGKSIRNPIGFSFQTKKVATLGFLSSLLEALRNQVAFQCGQEPILRLRNLQLQRQRSSSLERFSLLKKIL